MNKKQYEAMRKKLMDEAEGLINEGKIKEADSKMDEVKDLDEKWANDIQLELIRREYKNEA